jgi:hypothetical protein
VSYGPSDDSINGHRAIVARVSAGILTKAGGSYVLGSAVPVDLTSLCERLTVRDGVRDVR